MTDENKKQGQENEVPKTDASVEASQSEASESEVPEAALGAAVGGGHTNPLHK